MSPGPVTTAAAAAAVSGGRDSAASSNSKNGSQAAKGDAGPRDMSSTFRLPPLGSSVAPGRSGTPIGMHAEQQQHDRQRATTSQHAHRAPPPTLPLPSSSSSGGEFHLPGIASLDYHHHSSHPHARPHPQAHPHSHSTPGSRQVSHESPPVETKRATESPPSLPQPLRAHDSSMLHPAYGSSSSSSSARRAVTPSAADRLPMEEGPGHGRSPSGKHQGRMKKQSMIRD